MAAKVGAFIEYWGFKQIHGKIWTLVFLSPEPVDANYLKDTLKVSKALTSMTIKDLIHYNVILEVEKEKPGTQKYRINPEITQVILDVIQNREIKMLHQLQSSFKVLKSDNDRQNHPYIESNRLVELGTMIDTAHMLLTGMTAGGMVNFEAFTDSTSVKD